MDELEVPTSHPSFLPDGETLSGGASAGGPILNPEVLGAIIAGVLLVAIGAAIAFFMYQKRRRLRQKRAVELLALAYADGKDNDKDDDRTSRISAPAYFESVYGSGNKESQPSMEMYTAPPRRASARPAQMHRI